jgi:hypothetical protein
MSVVERYLTRRELAGFLTEHGFPISKHIFHRCVFARQHCVFVACPLRVCATALRVARNRCVSDECLRDTVACLRVCIIATGCSAAQFGGAVIVASGEVHIFHRCVFSRQRCVSVACLRDSVACCAKPFACPMSVCVTPLRVCGTFFLA